MIDIGKFVRDQLSVWPLAAANFRALRKVVTKEMTVGGLKIGVQFNPERIRSTTAGTSKAVVQYRNCFLCPPNRPAEQNAIRIEGRKGRQYDILVNPYPIFPEHLVIAGGRHERQSIWKRFVDMVDFAGELSESIVFYNGPVSGASAPEHVHFQACPKGSLPVVNHIDSLLDHGQMDCISSVREAKLYHYEYFARGIFALDANTPKSLAKLFYRLLDCAPVLDGDNEPRVNVFVWKSAGECRACVIFRTRHRPSHYFRSEEEAFMISPGCADMAGLLIVPRERDFERINPQIISEIMDEVCISADTEANIIWKMSRTQPRIEVGILSAPEISFEIISDGAGVRKVSYREGRIDYNGTLYDELLFEAATLSTMFAEPTFILHNVLIGKQFHWQRKCTQHFAGALKFIVENGMVTAVNIIGVEDYLVSVISSEMKSTASLEFLKAHAVISRSWAYSAMAQRRASACEKSAGPVSLTELVTRLDIASAADQKCGAGEAITWQGRGTHKLYDVCADDHCQRYQGLTMAVGENARKAVDATWGEVLTCDGEICDARFSKCCGGRTEVFSSCWEDAEYRYLRSFADTPGHDDNGDCFCSTDNREVLSQVLNDYDLEAGNFYRWQETFTPERLSALVAETLRQLFGLQEVGRTLCLTPLEYGPSGRIIRMEVVTEAGTFVVGKELTIRKMLSESHLRSSALELHWYLDGQEIAQSDVMSRGYDRLVLNGRGWGHGVGLCQVGAAVMASGGYAYRDILAHYYPETIVQCRCN